MKEFIKNKKVTYNLMSFTGYKALVLFSLLLEEPKSYKEVCNYFYNHPYLREKISIDTFRVYMNSLKRFGCEIKRYRGDDKQSRYVITSHPFELNVNPEQIQSITKIYKSLVKNVDIKELLAIYNLFEKIGAYIKNDDFISEIRKISMLNGIDKNLLKNLIDCCDKNEQIVIEYESPNSGVKNIEIITDKVEINNGKIYLYGITSEYAQYNYFPVSRINKIKEIKINRIFPDNLKEITVTYEVYTKNPIIDKNEKIISFENDVYTIEAVTSNKFILKQKLLEYGPDCKILGPEDFKEEFIELLKDMKAGYYCG